MSRHSRTAVRLLFPGELAEHASVKAPRPQPDTANPHQRHSYDRKCQDMCGTWNIYRGIWK